MSRPKTTEQFIKEAIILCKNVFLDFSKVEYKNTSTKVTIICHKKDANGCYTNIDDLVKNIKSRKEVDH